MQCMIYRVLLLFVCLLTQPQAFGMGGARWKEELTRLPERDAIHVEAKEIPAHFLYNLYKIKNDEMIESLSSDYIEALAGYSDPALYTRPPVLLEKSFFNWERNLGNSVFETRTGTGTAIGTSFLVSKNLILTNRHVVALSEGEPLTCGKLAIYLNKNKNSRTGELTSCKKVHYCGKSFESGKDFCLVEMDPTPSGRELGDIVAPLPMRFLWEVEKKDTLIMIGNRLGLGIQGTARKGEFTKEHSYSMRYRLDHSLDSESGNSGSPILDTTGAVLAIHYSTNARNKDSDKKQSSALKSNYLLHELFCHLERSLIEQIELADTTWESIYQHKAKICKTKRL